MVSQQKSGKFTGLMKRLLGEVTVEPLVFLNFLALAYFAVPMQTGIYKVLCIKIFPGRDCTSLSNDPAAEDVLQKAASLWSQLMAACYLGPALISDTLMGALGDIYGRKINILIGITGMIVAWYSTMVVFAYPQLPLFILLCFNLIAGFTGFLSIVLISSFAYLADVVPEKEDLTTRMVILQMVISAAAVIGSISAAACIRIMSNVKVICIGVLLMTIAFFYSLIRLDQVPPDVMRRLILLRKQRLERNDSVHEHNNVEMVKNNQVQPASECKTLSLTEEKEKVSCSSKFSRIVGLVKKVLHETYLTYTKPRPDHNRLFIWICFSVYFLHVVVDMGLQHSVFNLFLMRRPLSWTAENISLYRGAAAFINTAGSFIGVLILKKLFKFRDTALVLTALISSIADRIFTGLSTKGWMIYAATSCGCLSTLLLPTMKSFTAQLVGHDEVGKVFTGFGLGSNVAHLLSAILLNSLYSATVSIYPGFVFFFGACLSFIGSLFFAFVHFEQKKYLQSNEKTDERL
ncbi:MFS 1 domain containing protein [Trichuris trichiura]|uniref:MFS 1 domain containing protein n=1 Tax=Trichuris trichiura TaxID=36087 RepID=A0A077YXI8_TRITR|nr:MFS 1 domain containing protein [Trichuris trichiura]